MGEADPSKSDQTTTASVEDEEQLPPHLKIGSEFTFRVTVLHAYDVSPEYTDIFCQFK